MLRKPDWRICDARPGRLDTPMPDHMPSLTEMVAAVLAIVAVGAIVYLALEGQPNAQTALTGLVGAASSYFLTPRLNGKGTPKDPPVVT